MAGETTITIIGNLTADPELRTIGSGATVASFTIASTPRNYDRQSGQWQDGQALFMRCSAWRDLADHCAQSLSKGMRVIATGRLQQRSYQASDGSNRTVVEMQVDEIGPSLRYATAQVTRQSSGQGGFAGRNQGGNGGYGNNGGGFGNGGNGGYSGGASYAGGNNYSGGNGYQGGGSGFNAQPAQSAPSAPAAPQAPAADPWGSDAGSGSFSTFGGSSDFGGNADGEPEF
ncbi:single-stranded DNA-binding protein [Bifidobacterium sp. CP2]|uniref:single-stranded DNA-binding protein n=1 Tax=Bifidobacterium TaxID=1678 RepID=UPI001BDCC29B|nr:MULTISPECIES: single-stranded DNA-binding protein [Bifidobacterium]MBT1181762.1 single-stranded DNA-binding protein [Bifidobacterium sp. CP2]MBW3081543.1 single-stranded DNA-binding protein [Bifidobacterium saguinibicoloris]